MFKGRGDRFGGVVFDVQQFRKGEAILGGSARRLVIGAISDLIKIVEDIDEKELKAHDGEGTTSTASAARLDADGTAKPLTEFVGMFPAGKKSFYANAERLIARPTTENDSSSALIQATRYSKVEDPFKDIATVIVTLRYRAKLPGLDVTGRWMIAAADLLEKLSSQSQTQNAELEKANNAIRECQAINESLQARVKAVEDDNGRP